MKVSPDLAVASIEDAVAFYRDVLGFTPQFSMAGPDGKLAHAEVCFGDGNIMFDLLEMLPAEARANVGRGVDLYFNVGDVDIDAFYERVRKAGATIDSEITDQFWGDRHFSIQDPNGYHLSFAKTIRQVTEQEMAEAMNRT